MKKNVLDLLDIYCNSEITEFKSHQLYAELCNMVKGVGYYLECGYGRSLNDRDRNVYLDICIRNQNKEIVEVFDEGALCAATALVVIDQKERIRFFSWDDDDFVDSIYWIKRMLQEIKYNKNG